MTRILSEPQIVYQDNFLLVLNKPPGWIVNRAQTTKGRQTIQDWIEENFQFSIFNFRELRSGIVHRLDKDTSGILLIAKTQKTFENLQAQFKKRQVKKEYRALVHGILPLLKFTNGLVVYLSGDTGITAEQDLVVRGHYAAKLVVMNIGDTFPPGRQRLPT